MSEKTCRKCGHTTTYAPTSLEPQSCMECGGIYRKVEEAFQRAAEGRPSQLPRASVFSRVAATAPSGHRAYIEVLRSESLYPTWRQLVTLVAIFWYLLAAAALVGGVMAFKESFYAGLGGLGMALFLAIVGRVGKELAFMLADLSDATVRMAAKTEADRS